MGASFVSFASFLVIQMFGLFLFFFLFFSLSVSFSWAGVHWPLVLPRTTGALATTRRAAADAADGDAHRFALRIKKRREGLGHRRRRALVDRSKLEQRLPSAARASQRAPLKENGAPRREFLTDARRAARGGGPGDRYRPRATRAKTIGGNAAPRVRIARSAPEGRRGAARCYGQGARAREAASHPGARLGPLHAGL